MLCATATRQLMAYLNTMHYSRLSTCARLSLGVHSICLTGSIMIPMDTVKTRLVTQTVQAGVVPYRGVLDTLSRVVKEEGIGSLYRSLAPRLVSVVPMIGIQVRFTWAKHRAGLLLWATNG